MVLLLGGLVAVGAGIVFVVRAMTLPVVQVTNTVEGDVVQAFYATGTIVPEREYPVKAQVAGTLQLDPGIDKGTAVSKNQLLGRVVSDDLEKKLRQAEAELKEKRIRADEKESPVIAEFDHRIEAFEEVLASVKREHTRLLKLAEANNAPQVEIDRAFERIKTIGADVEATKAQRRAKILELNKDLEIATANYGIAKWNIDQQELRSPIDGVILDWPVPSRTRVAINDPILTLADVRPDRLVMRAQVDEEDRNELFEGQAVRMTLYSFPSDKDKFTGKVKRVYHKADPQRRTFEVDVEISRPAEEGGPSSRPATNTPATDVSSASTSTSPASNPTTAPSTRPYDRFAPGMTGELAFIEDERSNCTILPRQALQGEWFYIVRNGKLDRIAARAGVKNVTRVEVVSGIGPKDQVMISPIGRMEVGQAVRTEFINPRVAADMNKPKETGVFKGGF